MEDLTAKDAKNAKNAKKYVDRIAHTTAFVDAVATTIVDAAVVVHRELGPGLLESTYQSCLIHELRVRGMKVETELALPIRYGHLVVEAGYRIDMLIEDTVIIENKSVKSILPIHTAQLLTYLRLSGRTLGFLINWNVLLIKDGIQRVSNGHSDSAVRK